MSRYAANTEVSTERSEAEIKRLVLTHGATSFISGQSSQEAGGAAFVMFEMNGRRLRFLLKMPKVEEFNETETGRSRQSSTVVYRAWEQACKQRWRALLLSVRAKIEAVEVGIALFDVEFLGNFVTGDGHTIGDKMVPQLDKVCATGKLPSMMPRLPHLPEE